MIEVYVHINQVRNFLYLKEPVELIPNPLSEQYIKFNLDVEEVRIEHYRTFSTIELMTFRKKVKLWMRRFKKNKK